LRSIEEGGTLTIASLLEGYKKAWKNDLVNFIMLARKFSLGGLRPLMA
jgi:hypothetical protein